jgi:hypothetical protein
VRARVVVVVTFLVVAVVVVVVVVVAAVSEILVVLSLLKIATLLLLSRFFVCQFYLFVLANEQKSISTMSYITTIHRLLTA